MFCPNSLQDIPEVKKSEKCYCAGQYFHPDGDEFHEFILAQVEFHKVCLISLRHGNRWNDPVEVFDPGLITQEEFDKITNNARFFHSCHH